MPQRLNLIRQATERLRPMPHDPRCRICGEPSRHRFIVRVMDNAIPLGFSSLYCNECAASVRLRLKRAIGAAMGNKRGPKRHKVLP